MLTDYNLLFCKTCSEVCEDAVDERSNLLDLHQQLVAEGTIASSRLKGLSDYDRTLVRSDVAAAQLVNPTHVLSRSWLRHSVLIAISGLSRNSMQMYGGIPVFANADEEAHRRDLPEVQSCHEENRLLWRLTLRSN